MKQKKRLLVLLLIAISVIALVFMLTKKEKDSICIGVDLPLTGAYAYWGNEFKSGADIFCEKHPELNVVFEDNMGETKNAASVANKLINIDKVDALVSLFAPFSFPLRDIAETAKTPLISSFNSSTTFTTGYEYCFSDFATHDMQLPFLVDYVTDTLHLNRGVYYCVNDDYGTDGAKIATSLLDSKGIEISGEFFNTGDADHRNVLAKLLNDSVDFVFLIARDRDLVNAVNQIRERNKELLILGVGSFDAPVVWEGIPEENQQNIFFASSYFEKEYNEESKQFYDAFYKQHQREPNYPAIFGYTICQYLSDAITKAKQKNIPIKDVLEGLDYNSIRGNIKMTDKHVVYSSIAIYKRDGDRSTALILEKEMPE
jgi:ABC-type branched-subunit amino acid transport system substrate-binding protein